MKKEVLESDIDKFQSQIDMYKKMLDVYQLEFEKIDSEDDVALLLAAMTGELGDASGSIKLNDLRECILDYVGQLEIIYDLLGVPEASTSIN